MTEIFCENALLPEGWARHVTIRTAADGSIAAILPDSDPAPEADRLAWVIPGLPNLHSHAFQRGMAGLSERRITGRDSFWSWREVMYGFNDHLSPDDIEAIAALTYCEMLETGFTRVAEFHYLHHDVDGSPYSDIAEHAGRICAASRETGIELTLLPVFYRWAGFGEQPASHGQRRFFNDPDRYAALHHATRKHTDTTPGAILGIAPHSLRAAAMADLDTILPLAGDGPVHIHIAEQVKEVEDCLAATGARPVEHLFANQDVDARWCLVHATHMTGAETTALARSGAVAGLCPLTEANLGDGLFPAVEFLAEGGRFGVGSDSHIRIDLPEELRLLEYGQRLTGLGRNMLGDGQRSTGRFLFETALDGGAQACGVKHSGLREGASADLVALDADAPALVGRSDDTLLDSWIFAGDGRQVETVYVSGKKVVANGRSTARDRVEKAYASTMRRLAEKIGA